MKKIRILFLAANPVSTDRIRVDEEIRSIKKRLKLSKYRDLIELKSEWAVQPDDLLDILNEEEPDVVHFCGHGSETGELILHGQHGEAHPVTAQALQMLFGTLNNNLKLVFLNACYSTQTAAAIVEHIPCVVGMDHAISDIAAIRFAASFYRAIGFGRSLNDVI